MQRSDVCPFKASVLIPSCQAGNDNIGHHPEDLSGGQEPDDDCTLGHFRKPGPLPDPHTTKNLFRTLDLLVVAYLFIFVLFFTLANSFMY